VRILAVTSDYPPTPGGIARLSWCSAQALHDLGHEILVLATGTGESACREFDRQAPFVTKRVTSKLGLRELSMYIALRQSIREFRPDVIWSALWFPCAVLASYCPCDAIQVFSTYGSEILPNRKAGFKQWLKSQLGPLRRRVFRRSDWIFTLSRFTQDQVVALGAPREKTSVLPGGVDPHWFKIAPAPKDKEKPTLLTVARLDEHKGHDVVISALPQIRRRFPGVRYRIVGPSAGNWPRLEALAQQLGVSDCVEYWGKVPEEKLYRAYSEADLFVMPSREVPGRHVEGFGLTFLEAAALGVPSVGGRSGGVPDAIEDGYSGLLVEPSNSVELAEAIERLLGDPEYLKALGSQAQTRAREEFSWKAIGQQMASTFQRLVDGRTPGRRMPS